MSLQLKQEAEEILQELGINLDIHVVQAIQHIGDKPVSVCLQVAGTESFFDSGLKSNLQEAVDAALFLILFKGSTMYLQGALASKAKEEPPRVQTEFENQVTKVMAQKLKDLYLAAGITEENFTGLGADQTHQLACKWIAEAREEQLVRNPKLIQQLNNMEHERDSLKAALLSINSLSADAAS